MAKFSKFLRITTLIFLIFLNFGIPAPALGTAYFSKNVKSYFAIENSAVRCRVVYLNFAKSARQIKQPIVSLSYLYRYPYKQMFLKAIKIIISAGGKYVLTADRLLQMMEENKIDFASDAAPAYTEMEPGSDLSGGRRIYLSRQQFFNYYSPEKMTTNTAVYLASTLVHELVHYDQPREIFDMSDEIKEPPACKEELSFLQALIINARDPKVRAEAARQYKDDRQEFISKGFIKP